MLYVTVSLSLAAVAEQLYDGAAVSGTGERPRCWRHTLLPSGARAGAEAGAMGADIADDVRMVGRVQPAPTRAAAWPITYCEAARVTRAQDITAIYTPEGRVGGC